MKFLILNTDYPEFLRWLYARHPGIEQQPYEEQLRVRNESLFGVADFYSSNLRKLGHEAYDIHTNNWFVQKMWAVEHGIRLEEPSFIKQHGKQILLRYAQGIVDKISLTHLKSLLWPLTRSVDSWFYNVLEAQIRYYKPDILFNQAISEINSHFLTEMKPYVRLIVGQHAATSLSDAEDFSCYDLIISSFPPTVEYFRKKGIPAELNRLGFEPAVLSVLKSNNRNFDITFVGSFQSVHTSRVAFLESLCEKLPQIKIWGTGIERLSHLSPIQKCYVGPAWGIEMYRILINSKITLNHHGDIPPYANNMRLYEATGTGSLLVTDWKENLQEMFEIGKEVIAYRSTEECLELIQYYLKNNEERETIASAGQQRTLRKHTYYKRMQELVDIVCKYL